MLSAKYIEQHVNDIDAKQNKLFDTIDKLQ